MTHFQVRTGSRRRRLSVDHCLESPIAIQFTPKQCIRDMPLGVDFLDFPGRYQGLSSLCYPPEDFSYTAMRISSCRGASHSLADAVLSGLRGPRDHPWD